MNFHEHAKKLYVNILEKSKSFYYTTQSARHDYACGGKKRKKKGCWAKEKNYSNATPIMREVGGRATLHSQ